MAGTHERKFFENAITVSNLLGEEDTGLGIRLLKATALITAICLLVSTLIVASFFSAGSENKELMQAARNIFTQNQDSSAKGLIKELKAVYPDSVGWLYVPNTEITTPVLQGDNDKYYINHNIAGEKSRYGAVFLSHSDSLDEADNDKNLLIYGNNMTDGQMFGTLKNYRNVNFYKANPGFYFYSPRGRDTYVVCAVMLLDVADNGGFDVSKSHFADSDEFNVWYREIHTRSIINTGQTAQYFDSFITLITPAPDFDGARLAVVAKRISNMDTGSINTSGAVANGKVKYPDKWYKSRGIEPQDKNRKEEQNASEPQG